MMRERCRKIGYKRVLLLGWDVLDDIESINGIVLLRQRSLEDVVKLCRDRPFGRLPAANVLNEDGVEIVSRDGINFLLNDSGSESIAAPDFCDRAGSTQHFGDEFVSRQDKAQASRILVPDLIGHQTERTEPDLLLHLQQALVLRLPGRVTVSAGRSVRCAFAVDARPWPLRADFARHGRPATRYVEAHKHTRNDLPALSRSQGVLATYEIAAKGDQQLNEDHDSGERKQDRTAPEGFLRQPQQPAVGRPPPAAPCH